MKKVITAVSVAVLFAAAATGVAGAEEPEFTDGFVCPVLGGHAGANFNGNQPFAFIAGGDATIIGPNITVPVHATNQDGAGTPGGDHASPGDPDYSAIWG